MSLPTVAKIGIGWTITAVAGIYGFAYSKRNIDARRYENMKSRERIRNAGMLE